MSNHDVIIIGGGASGLMCAALAAKRGRRVLVLEKAKQCGRKILMSGGGRCNFTNLEISAKNYLGGNEHFCISALKRYSQWDFIAKVLEYNIAYHERDLGKLFCDDSAKPILDMLLNECTEAGVVIKTQISVQSVESSGNRFLLATDKGQFQCQSLVLATGGLSIPSMGGDGLAYKIAEQFGLKTVPRRAGLVPLTLSDEIKTLCQNLSGLALDCQVQLPESCAPSFTEAVLFTHRGLSGPAILQLSNYWREGQIIELDLLPHHDLQDYLFTAKKQHGRQQLNTVLNKLLAKNLVQELAIRFWPEIGEKPLADIADNQLKAVVHSIKHWQIKPAGTEGYRTAEVTLGGVCSDELSSKTFAAIKQNNLFFIGEAVDVTGWLGGYNFQWAWSSAAAAAQFV